MLSQETIDKWSWFYRFLQVFVVRPIHSFYYRKIKIVNADVIPRNKPVILAPNHQNALMDAMALVAGIDFQTIFLTRADIFKGNFLIKVLTFFKMLPVYRIRDGYSSLQNNDRIFGITVNILHRGSSPLLLFPEGNHGDKRRLRPLVKGIFRIAFQAQEKYKSAPGVKIIPVGLDYSHYWKFRNTQLIIFGEPIEVSDFWKLYTENETTAVNALKEKLAGEMKKYMIHVEPEDYYELYMGLKSLYRKKMCSREGLHFGDLYDNFIADKKLIAILDTCNEKEPETLKELNELYMSYSNLRTSLNLRDWVAEKKSYPVIPNIIVLLLSVVMWPLVLLGLFNNWPHFFIPVRFTRNVKDKQFWSTAKWGSGLGIMIIYYPIIAILALIFLPLWWIKLLYLITMYHSGIFAYNYRNFLVKTWARIRYSVRTYRKDPKTMEFKALYDRIISLTDKIIENNLPTSDNN